MRGGGWCARPVDTARARPPAPPACRPLPAAPQPSVDSAFPTLDSVLRQLNDPEAQTLFKLLDQQAVIEKRVKEAEDKLPEEYVPPEPVTEFQTARLFLSHFGYLNIGGDKKSGSRLTLLDDSLAGFSAALRRVDACGARAPTTAHVFYVRGGRTRPGDVLANAGATDLHPGYIQLLRGLGKGVLVRGHAGWTGHAATSYDAPPAARAAPRPPPDPATPAIYDGREQVLYWSDSTSEIAFVVPSGYEIGEDDAQTDSIKSDVDGSCVSSRSTEKTAGSNWDISSGSSGQPSYERSISESERNDRTKAQLNDKLRALSLDLDKQPTANTGLTGSGRRNRDFTTKILIFWLEDFEDHLNLPLDELLRYCETGVPWRRHEVTTICVSARRCGLLLVGAGGAPLHRAQLAPRLAAPALRRQALDIARRHRLLTDLYQPPHVRRRHLIQELAQNYKKDLTEPELLESLFKTPS